MSTAKSEPSVSYAKFSPFNRPVVVRPTFDFLEAYRSYPRMKLGLMLCISSRVPPASSVQPLTGRLLFRTNARASMRGSECLRPPRLTPPPPRSSSRPSTKPAAIGPLVDAPPAAGAWHEILVVDDGSTDATAAHAAAARARASSGIRTTRATAPRSRPASAQPTGALRPDHRRRRPASAGGRRASGRRSSTSTTSSSARARRRRRRAWSRRARQRRAEPARELSDRAADSRSDVGLPRRAPRAACSSSCTCCPTASRRRRRRRWRSCKAGYSVRFEPIEAAQRAGHRRRSGSAPTACSFFLILLKVITHLQPAADLRCRSAPRAFAARRGVRASGRSPRSRTSRIRRCC